MTKGTKSWVVIVGMIICGLIFSCTITYPFNNDNALYAYMADLALNGHLPYIGSWDQNFPGIVAVHAVQILVSGRSPLAFRIFDIALQLTGSFLLIKIGERLYDIRAGMLAAVLASLYYVQQGFWMSGERDTYVSIMLLAAFYFALDKRKPLLVGILCSLAFLFRPTYAPYEAIFGAWFIIRFSNTKREGWGTQPLQLGVSPPRQWRHTQFGKFVIGTTILPIAVILLYASNSGLKDFWEATILFNLKVYGGSGASFSFWEPVRFYAISLIALAIGVFYLWKKEEPVIYLWSALFAVSVLSLIMLYRHSVYHYHPAMTMFILMSSVGWIYLADLCGKKFAIIRIALPICIAIFFLAQTFRGNTIQAVLLDIANGRINSLEGAYERYEPSPDFGWKVQTEVGDYLRAHTNANDTVQMFGPYSYPQYRAGLLTASRFQTLHAITMRGANDTLQTFQKEWRTEYLRDMQSVRPKYFIVCDAPEAFRQYYGGRLGHEILKQDFQELGVWLDANYSAETKIGAFTLYRSR